MDKENMKTLSLVCPSCGGEMELSADGVLTAGYGSLQGFNFGYNHGFSYAQSFSGWTDAAEMEADLRHARDGYHLVN